MRKEKQFPIGIQHFSRIRTENYQYVDKTKIIHHLITNSVGAFLSRPRRFGKSLLISTLEALFTAQRDLFSGLWIKNSDWHWTKYHVIKLDFSGLVSSSTEALEKSLQDLVLRTAAKLGVRNIQSDYSSITLIHLIEKLAESRKVVILIDEYDKPLIHHLDQPDLLSRNRDLLRDFFAVIKSLGEHIQFSFITGVSKFTKVSLFSGMNNLENISLEPEYASLIGLTESEIVSNFKDQIEAVPQPPATERPFTLTTLLKWYNGYRFSKDQESDRIYNPLSVMQCIQKKRLENFWFSTATPTFAIELIKRKNFPITKLEEEIIAGDEIEMSYEVDHIDLPTLLFQTGYLTIKTYDPKSQFYQLGFPNEEVRRSFLSHLLQGFSTVSSSEVNSLIFTLSRSLKNENLDKFVTSFNQLISTIPYQIHLKKEAYYHSMIYLVLRTLGFKVDAEVSTSKGRIDMVMKMEEKLFIFEFKIDSDTKSGMEQILSRGYHHPFQIEKEKIVLISINFSTQSREISDYKLLT